MAPPPVRPGSFRARWRARAEILLVAAVYYVSSRLALELVPGWGHATAVWPASGFMLASVLLLGSRVWPGVVLGSLAASLGSWLRAEDSSSLIVAIASSVAIAFAASAQALVGAFSVKRLAGYPNTLSNESDVLRFLVLAGPVSSLIRASIGVASLSMLGAIAREDVLFTFGIWWAGDTFGTALFAPLALLWFDGSIPVRWRRKICVSAPLLLTITLSVVVFEQVAERERERARGDFDRRCDVLSQGLRQSFDASFGSLESLGSFFDAAERIDPKPFGTFARSTLARVEAIQAIAWVPRIRHADREECAPLYLEPADPPGWKLGSDMAADPVHGDAMARARDSGEPAATAPAPIGEAGRGEIGFFVYRPVYLPGDDLETVESRRRRLVGYAAGLFVVPDLLRESLSGTEARGLGIELVDVTNAGEERRLHGRNLAPPESARERPEGVPAVRVTSYALAGRAWELRLARVEALNRRSWQAWAALAGGLLFTGLLGAFLMVVTGRADAIEELVARRTKEIERANENLRREIGERARAEAQHQQSEARLAAAQQIAHLGSWELDLRMNRFLWSDELYRIHGLPKRSDEWIDFATFLSQVHPEDQGVVDALFGRAQGDHRPFGFRYRIVRPDGSVRTLDGRGEITLDPVSGKATRMHGTGQDVTEIEEAERELAERTVELERGNAELERFAYVASHDLQEPLRAVASHVQILQEDYQGKLDADADESIRCAVEGARRMRDLIQDYLAYSRVRIGADPLEPTSSEDALARAVYGLDELILETRARVTHDELPEVIADPSQLADLFKNLIANAVKFRREEAPRVHVSAARADKTWVFSLRDNGIGIDPEHTGRIFQLFQRLHTQDRYPGTGIGLAICKKIVERHGGRIWVESMPGMGSVFHFTLAVEAEERGARVADKGEAAALIASCGIELGDLR